jgi:hypothetical protein
MIWLHALADDLQVLLTSQEAVLANTLDGPDGLFMVLQMQHRLEIPPYDRGSVRFKSAFRHQIRRHRMDLLVPASGNDQSRITRVQGTDVVLVTDERMRRLL